MTKTVFKLFWLWNFDREEAWLNEMSQQGWHLCRVGLCTYVFERGEPGQYIYRLEMLSRAVCHPESVKYLTFIEETGAQQVGTLFSWVYFRKQAGEGGFDLFSDIPSRLMHLDRMLWSIAFIVAFNVFNFVNLLAQWLERERAFSAAMFVLCLSVAVLGSYGVWRILRKRRALSKMKILQE